MDSDKSIFVLVQRKDKKLNHVFLGTQVYRI